FFFRKEAKVYLTFCIDKKVSKKLAGRTHKIQFRTAHFTTRLRLGQIKCFLCTKRIVYTG
ncbi:MAG: hypothetical protein ACI351_00030, partial [Candidatus Avelusimicrobium sp.]|uniref:hypothetical protein n=1 Tax=Candidatus Avelusimicrobium sp. TaxID=3048833 RepID=UPI003F055039